VAKYGVVWGGWLGSHFWLARGRFVEIYLYGVAEF
jgi:hypothetical protein